MFPFLNLPLILGRHKICMIEEESQLLSNWASEWTSLFDYMLLVWMKLYHGLALEVRAQPQYVVLLVINLWTNAYVFRVYVCMRESVLCMCVCVCEALSSFIGSPFMGHWPLSFMRGPIVILVTRTSTFSSFWWWNLVFVVSWEAKDPTWVPWVLAPFVFHAWPLVNSSK